MTIYPTFVDFMEQRVIPTQKANPSHIRLDGKIIGGNRRVFGYFKHSGRTWKVHSDTHYAPLMTAYKQTNQGLNPFNQVNTPNGKLSLKVNQSTQPYYHYIYED
jgi:hypothetical protein